jgi:uncharacterized protein YebE (UPF0316 family)
MGTLIVRVFLTTKESKLKEHLYEAGFGVTTIEAQGRDGPVDILFSVIKRKDVDKVVKIIESSENNAFYSIEEAKSVSKGVFPLGERRWMPSLFRRKTYFRHGK